MHGLLQRALALDFSFHPQNRAGKSPGKLKMSRADLLICRKNFPPSVIQLPAMAPAFIAYEQVAALRI
jgi:hypothetical protein